MISGEPRGSSGGNLNLGCREVVLAGGACALALPLHQTVELGQVHLDSIVAQDVLSEIEGESVGVVEFECDRAGEAPSTSLLERRLLLLDEFKAPVQSFTEASFLGRNHLGDFACLAAKLGISVTHRGDDPVIHGCQERPMDPQIAAVPRGAPYDAAQDVFAVGVTGSYALGHQEGHGSCVVCYGAEGDIRRWRLPVVAALAQLARGGVGLL